MKHLKLSEISPHPNNPKDITPIELEKLKNSIQGFQRMMEIKPIIYDENNQILAGNQRYKALVDLGYVEIPISWTKQVKGVKETYFIQFLSFLLLSYRRRVIAEA